ncbi:conserved protein of unknown function [Sterolibacterium denitrificans]|uniref:Uncharacterized protein n=2 Tax=Sterolibacterium denitrificans TaxID=157592 RepID=A0A7Z7HRB7_9PROT|nr:conserved protein of unknown function [Sterolibacterium denitrificans]
MNPLNELRFAVSDRINDAEVGPRHVPLSLLGDFQKDVSEFLRGSTRDVDPAEVLVSVDEGSLALVASGLMAATTLWADLERLQSLGSLNLIDPKRAAVVERWQTSARQNPHRKYRVADMTAARISLSVDVSTDFRRVEEVWVTVEKYVHGKVMDLGGKTKPNVHLEMSDGTVLKVSTTQKLLAQEEQNRLYRSALLHISAEENLLTGALRNPVLLAFEAHQPAYDEAEFQQMVRRGTAAWSDVPDAAEWLEGLRGGRA